MTTPVEPTPAVAPTVTPTPPATPAPVAEVPAPAVPAQEPDWKAEARKWEQRAKDNKSAAEKLAEIEEASKTEAQKQAERTATLEAKVAEYETKEQIAAWKAEVAEATGVPAVALAGSTKEEIEAHASLLKPLIGQQPTEEPRPGVVPTIGKTPNTPPNIPLKDQIAALEAKRDGEDSNSAAWKAVQAQVMELKGMQLFEAAQTK